MSRERSGRRRPVSIQLRFSRLRAGINSGAQPVWRRARRFARFKSISTRAYTERSSRVQTHSRGRVPGPFGENVPDPPEAFNHSRRVALTEAARVIWRVRRAARRRQTADLPTPRPVAGRTGCAPQADTSRHGAR